MAFGHVKKNSEDGSQKPVQLQSNRRKWLKRILIGGGALSIVGLLSAVGIITWVFIHYGQDLPDYGHLKRYEPEVMTRVHTGEGALLTEFSRKKRLFVPVDNMPQTVLNAFVAAEDKNFFEHDGLDYLGIVRAIGQNIELKLSGSGRLVGASTITQQVSRNFLLTLDQQLDRKIKEMILTLRIEQAFTKDEILELYLNEIYLGGGNYGVASAALHYFDKSLDQLTLGEVAYLAGVPKGPNNYHPVRNKARALIRRDYVLGRMREDNYITQAEWEVAKAEDLIAASPNHSRRFRGEYFGEQVRRDLRDKYGSRVLLEDGMSVHTSLDTKLQTYAEDSLRRGLVDYDRRHGWRGPLAKITVGDDWPEQLSAKEFALGIDQWEKAVVLNLETEGALIGLISGQMGYIPFEEVKWARKWIPGDRVGYEPEDIGQVLAIGDIIAVEKLADAAKVDVSRLVFEDFGDRPMADQYALHQIPEIEGALVALDPHTGRVLAMVGGYDYGHSQFNRAVQADRQPGSAFKPFVYATALSDGFTPASLVLDAPYVIDMGPGKGKWKPMNSSNKFYGPSTLRLGLEKSRNLMTVRLAQHMGMNKVMEYADRFGLGANMEPNLAMSLGAGEVTLMQLTTAYGMLVNGGKKIEPSLIDRIQDRNGKTIFRHDQRTCDNCNVNWSESLSEPELPDVREQAVDPAVAYQLVSMMEGVVERGTGRKIRVLNRPLAGKTGTTDDSLDAWFVGFSPDLVVGVFVGFDNPRTLGRYEEGSSVAVPIFRDFMRDALNGQPKIPFRIPEGVRLVRVDSVTGQPARIGDKNVILEAFKPGTEPRRGQITVLDGSGQTGQRDSENGSGVIY